jgi:hypothetical protein
MKTVDDSTSTSWESVYKISRSWAEELILYVLSFGALYLVRCDFAMDPTKENHKLLFKSRKNCDGDSSNG